MVIKEFTNKPLVKLFRTPRKFYLYDAVKDEVCSICKETYDFLQKGNYGNFENDEIKELKEKGFLSNSKILAIKHPYTEDIKEFLDNHMHQLILQVTQACNLSCIYCPYANSNGQDLQRSVSNKTMNFETAKKAIDYFAIRADAHGDAYISFYGGEPVIEYPLIRQCVDYAEKRFEGKRVKFGITTNATLMNDEIIEFFAQKKFVIMFSMDGPADIHNKNRLTYDGHTTYDEVMETIRKTASYYGSSSLELLKVNMVFDTADSFEKILQWIKNPIFKHVGIQFSLINNEQLKNPFTSDGDYFKRARYILALELARYIDLIPDLSENPLFYTTMSGYKDEFKNMKDDRFAPGSVISVGAPCMSGSRKLFVNVDGYYYPCEKVNELSPNMIIGTIDTGIDIEVVKKHLNFVTDLGSECEECWARLHCNLCQKYLGDLRKLGEHNDLCRNSRAGFLELLHIYALFDEARTVYKNIP